MACNSGASDSGGEGTKLLIVDDDTEILSQLEWALGSRFKIYKARNRPEALSIQSREGIGLVLLDLGLPPHPRDASEGLETLEAMLARDPLAKVVIVSGNSERENAVRAIERGAFDVFPKPIDIDQLRVVLERVERRMHLERESAGATQTAASPLLGEIVGSSPCLVEAVSTIRKVARADVPVLITGESGTGKELAARAIHRLSSRRAGPFIAINCGAIPEHLIESELFGHEKGAFTGAHEQRRGKLEFADGGTLFLDEIAELSPALQVKLLRFLQEHSLERVGGRESIRVDVRVIAATHRNLEEAAREGTFREDLYFRIAVVRVHLPPLRERGDDVLELAEHFIREFTAKQGIKPRRLSAAAVDALRSYSWPGNVRELQNRIHRALVLGEGALITPRDLDLEEGGRKAKKDPGYSDSPLPAADLRSARESLERNLVVRALQEAQGNISRAARILGISRPTLYDLMDRFGLREKGPSSS